MLMALLKPGSVLMSMAPATIQGHMDAWSLGSHLGAMLASKGHAATKAMKIWVIYAALRGNGCIQAQLLLRNISGSVAPPMGSVLKSEACVVTKLWISASVSRSFWIKSIDDSWARLQSVSKTEYC